MLNDAIDLRVVKTLENIKNGFAICINKKSFTSITIKDITTAAKINRSTFYKYYHDKYDLRELLVKSTLEELSNSIGSGSFNLKYNEIYRSKNALIKQLQFMYDNRDWYVTLWNKNMELYIYEDMQCLFEERIRGYLSSEFKIAKNELSQEQELFARLFAASAMTTIKWWYTYSQNMSPKDIADIIIDNITIGMHRAFFQNI